MSPEQDSSSTGDEESQRKSLFAAQYFAETQDCVFERQTAVELMDIDVNSWKVEFLHPKRSDVLISAEMFSELKRYFTDIYEEECQFINARVTKWARCRVNGTCFSSDLNRSDRCANVMAYWAINEHPGVCKYYGHVRFFFHMQCHPIRWFKV